MNRETVGKYVGQADAQNQPNAPTGTDAAGGDRDAALGQNQPNAPTGSAGPPPNGPPSDCEPFREEILAKVEQGLEAVRIHQDLVEEHGEGAPSYYSVRRFVARLKHKTPLPFRRMETEPGEEAQVDFGTGAPVRTADGKRPPAARLPHRPELQPQGVQRGRLAADHGIVHRGAWRTPSGISAACPSGW